MHTTDPYTSVVQSPGTLKRHRRRAYVAQEMANEFGLPTTKACMPTRLAPTPSWLAT
jgi:hypothetical protein